jgi:ferredoxin-NADP reductase
VIEELTHSHAPAGGWKRATIRQVDHPTAHGVRLRLEVRDRVQHLPGQHYVVRLTAPDGYVAQRSYSVASAPSDPMIELFVERLDGGEVSGYLAEVAMPGDQLDVRGPIGGWFVWRGDSRAVGVAGGSGVVPIVSMLRHATDAHTSDLLHIAVSTRTVADLAYADELAQGKALIATTRQMSPAGRAAGRLTAVDLEPFIEESATWFICGSAGFAETTSDNVLEAGITSNRIRIERFGPSG